ncbi:MAG: hypothetical protein IT288_07830 [Bdellovibrionales bacterium]|nr:hypothetical protein [Bdellovibrionales bacterium]
MRGLELLAAVAEASGLPQSLIIQELQEIANRAGIPVEQLSLDDLRALLADYLQDVLISAKAEYSRP